MPSIFPESPNAGGLPVRDGAGNPANPPGVERAYSPPPAFISNCPITALPSDCTARIEPRQINAIVSEMLALAECWDANGPWDCNALRNLCAAFTTWASTAGVIISDTPPVGVRDRSVWWESDTGFLFVLYNDGNTTQWVQIAGGTIYFDGISIIGSGMQGDPYKVGTIDCGTW